MAINGIRGTTKLAKGGPGTSTGGSLAVLASVEARKALEGNCYKSVVINGIDILENKFNNMREILARKKGSILGFFTG